MTRSEEIAKREIDKAIKLGKRYCHGCGSSFNRDYASCPYCADSEEDPNEIQPERR